MKKTEVSNKKKFKILERIVKDIFGLNVKLDWSKWSIESDKIEIRDIDWSEDLLTCLNRLRDYFFVNIELEIEGEGKRKYPILVIELIVRNE